MQDREELDREEEWSDFSYMLRCSTSSMEATTIRVIEDFECEILHLRHTVKGMYGVTEMRVDKGFAREARFSLVNGFV